MARDAGEMDTLGRTRLRAKPHELLAPTQAPRDRRRAQRQEASCSDGGAGAPRAVRAASGRAGGQPPLRLCLR